MNMTAHAADRKFPPSPRVYLDFDDVLCETAQALADLHHELHGRRVAFEDIHSFNLWESFSLTQNEYEHLMDRGHEDEFLFNVAATPGFPGVLSRWHDSGIHISIVTGRPPATADVSEAWLDVNGAAYDDIVFVDKYNRNAPGDDSITLDQLNTMPFMAAVDDAPRMIDHLVTHTPFPVIVFDRPWNRHIDTRGPSPRRARTWSELEHLVLASPAEECRT